MSKKVQIFSLGLVGFFLLGCSAIGLSLWYFFSPLGGDSTLHPFIVTKGDTLTSISGRLQEQKFIRSALSLRLLYKLSGDSTTIQPGTYKLSAAMAPKETLNILFSDTQDVWVTLKEGWRAEEDAQVLASKLHATFSADEFTTLAKPVEGKLFPDTYLLSKDMNAQEVFVKLTSTFADKYQKATDEVGAGTLSARETLILASLVQREGKDQADMRVVAGIMLNRIKVGMPLQVDATLQYVRGYDVQKQTWWTPPTSSDKELVSPFNTYKNVGLPPTPICNPGLAAIEAALDPEKSDYVYYLHDPQGKPHYAVTYEEHQKNIATYLK